MDDKFERAIRNKNTLSVVRSEVQEMPDLQPASQESTSEVICLLEERFSRMKLKGNHIKVYPAASHDNVVEITLQGFSETSQTELPVFSS